MDCAVLLLCEIQDSGFISALVLDFKQGYGRQEGKVIPEVGPSDCSQITLGSCIRIIHRLA